MFYLVEIDSINRRTGRHELLEFIETASSPESASQKACEFVMGDYNYELMAVESVECIGRNL